MLYDSTWLTNPKNHHHRLFAGGEPSFKSSPADVASRRNLGQVNMPDCKNLSNLLGCHLYIQCGR